NTLGLEEPKARTKGLVESVESTYRITNELDRQGGIDLLLFYAGAGAVPATFHWLSHEFFCEKKVLMVLAITNLEGEQRMED
ncbi:hypothetical protein F4604DRAFT_1542563, partial [Suillus subluteus]